MSGAERDMQWLADTVRRARTLQEAQLAVSVFVAERMQMPLRVPTDAMVPLRLVVGEKPDGAA